MVLCNLTQYPKSNPSATTLDVDGKLCKITFTSWVRLLLQLQLNVGEKMDRMFHLPHKNVVVFHLGGWLSPIQHKVFWYPWQVVDTWAKIQCCNNDNNKSNTSSKRRKREFIWSKVCRSLDCCKYCWIKKNVPWTKNYCQETQQVWKSISTMSKQTTMQIEKRKKEKMYLEWNISNIWLLQRYLLH